ncbi:MAG: RiPP maturation radical SAM C-methyltransferase [Candidatus Thiodiazotropha endolucinida]
MSSHTSDFLSRMEPEERTCSARHPGNNGIAFVCMPFTPLTAPSLATGILTAEVKRAGIACETFHYNLQFLDIVGTTFLTDIVEAHCFSMPGDYVFSDTWSKNGFHAHQYREAFRRSSQLSSAATERVLEKLDHVRNKVVPQFLDQIVNGTDWDRYELVCLTSTFQQHAASLAFAKRLSNKHHEVPILIGGANLQGALAASWLEGAPFLNYACCGEGEDTIVALVQALRAGTEPKHVINLVYRNRGRVRNGPIRNDMPLLNRAVLPDFTDHFLWLQKHAPLNLREYGKDVVSFETSRGCWWGEKHHCTFCALNTSSIKYRQKSKQQIANELEHQHVVHGAKTFFSTDNIIDWPHVKDALTDLQQKYPQFEYFFEIKANQSSTSLKEMAVAGVRYIQPGIESLSTPMLARMKKGSSAIQNVLTLKFAKIYGMKVFWNLLWRVPEERPEDLLQQIALIPSLLHLPAPVCFGEVVLMRFSPLYDNCRNLGLQNVQPIAEFDAIYGDLGIRTHDCSLYFSYELNQEIPASLVSRFHNAIEQWKQAYIAGASLVYRERPGDGLTVFDSRKTEKPTIFELSHEETLVFKVINERISTLRSLQNALGHAVSHDRIGRILDDFNEHKLLMREGSKYLGLAMPYTSI